MNKAELDALVKEQAEQAQGNAKASYTYVVGLMTATEVDLDELKLHLDVLARLKDKLDAESQGMVVTALRAVAQNAEFPAKLRERVEIAKRVVWGDLHKDDPIQKEIDAKILDLADAGKKADALRWLKEHKDLLPDAPPAAKVSVK